MAGKRRAGRQEREAAPADLFSSDPSSYVMYSLDGATWPHQQQFPVNRAGARVRHEVREDLAASAHPLIVAGYSSIAELVDFFADWADRQAPPAAAENKPQQAQVRVLLGVEPYPSRTYRFGSATAAFTEEVRSYWEERGISLLLSAKLVQAIEAIDAGRLTARFIHGHSVLHAKAYVGDTAATIGSSNFSAAGLHDQLEANARFERATERDRYDGVRAIAENLWDKGERWDAELRALLEGLLRMVGWREALARACAMLLEGEWASRYLEQTAGVGEALWPSQRAGIAQALWIIESVGSVLVADATGSGKTRMGAHLVRAVRDRLWSTGRTRRDFTAVVCPPSVEPTWQREASRSGVNLTTVSHGLLSRSAAAGTRTEEDAVNLAQILAIDESHNFLNPAARRTQQVRDSRADHVLLFTATPINRGPADLLQLVGFLGPDNFEDETLDVLRRLDRRRGDQLLAPADVDRLRREIQRFTVRRTKTLLNHLVDREPDAYRDDVHDRICRYPRHDAQVYATGETSDDAAVADRIRALAGQLVGLAQLETAIAVPASLRREYTDERWLEFRLASVRGLAAHHVLAAMRSSRAALHEHLAGTAAAARAYGLSSFKPAPTGDVIAKLRERADSGPPAIGLDCAVPDWLTDPARWRAECLAEAERYESMLADTGELSDARERAKAALLVGLLGRHDRVLAFDRHPITLEALRVILDEMGAGVEVIVATGSTDRERRRVQDRFARTATNRALALCSDALNEGLNLQGASAVVHLDLPTTLRVAEQRIGRVDRMDSPHDAIEALWPDDGPSFATRANEVLVQRAAESAQLLGSNLHVPLRGAPAEGATVDVGEAIAKAESADAQTWDGIRDALDPVRELVGGQRPLVPADLYEAERHRGPGRVLAAVESTQPWAFLAIAAGGGQGAPRWLFLDGAELTPVVGLDEVAERLRLRLSGEPADVALDAALSWMERAVQAAGRAERLLLPRRMQRALEQMSGVCASYTEGEGDFGRAERWRAIGRLARAAGGQPAPGEDGVPEPYAVAEAWLELVRPWLDRARQRPRRRQQFVLLRDIDRDLRADPLDLDEVEAALGGLARMAPLEERVEACILGVPVASPRHTQAGPSADSARRRSA